MMNFPDPISKATDPPGSLLNTCLHFPSIPHRQEPPLADLQVARWAVGEVGVQRTHHPNVPHFDLVVHTRRDHVVA